MCKPGVGTYVLALLYTDMGMHIGATPPLLLSSTRVLEYPPAKSSKIKIKITRLHHILQCTEWWQMCWCVKIIEMRPPPNPQVPYIIGKLRTSASIMWQSSQLVIGKVKSYSESCLLYLSTGCLFSTEKKPNSHAHMGKKRQKDREYTSTTIHHRVCSAFSSILYFM